MNSSFDEFDRFDGLHSAKGAYSSASVDDLRTEPVDPVDLEIREEWGF